VFGGKLVKLPHRSERRDEPGPRLRKSEETSGRMPPGSIVTRGRLDRDQQAKRGGGGGGTGGGEEASGRAVQTERGREKAEISAGVKERIHGEGVRAAEQR